MVEKVREALRRRPLLGVVISLAIHAVLIAMVVGVHPQRTAHQKRGDALIVELPNIDEPASTGTPGPAPGEPALPAAPPQKAAPSAPSTPPTPAVKPTPPPRAVAKPAPPAPKAAPREAPRAVASAPQLPSPDRGDIPSPKPAPQATPQPPRENPDAAKPPESARPDSAVASAPPVPPSPPGPVAMVPPTPPDLRSAFRRGGGGGGTGSGGAGGTGVGRGGILGEPIPLDSKDPDFSDYLERIRQLIKQNWGYPCVKNAETRECEYKSARLVVDFGILRGGPVQFVEIQRSSGWAIYDDYAVNAIKLASPFPPVPSGLLARIPRGSTGIPIRVNFNYMVETGVTNVIR